MIDVVERLRALDYNVDVAMYWHDPECLPEAANEVERMREALVRICNAKQMDYSFDDLRTIAHVALKGNQ